MATKNDDVKNLLGKLPAKKEATKTPPIIQEVVEQTTPEKAKVGRKKHRKDDVNYVRISPAIPEDLKMQMDIAIKSTLKNRYPTIDTFVEEAIRQLLAQS
jgi:hypothetical protein